MIAMKYKLHKHCKPTQYPTPSNLNFTIKYSKVEVQENTGEKSGKNKKTTGGKRALKKGGSTTRPRYFQ
jgi:hypothetical protein